MTSTSQATFIIAGASLAGAKGAEELRHAGFDGRIVLVGEEDHQPYERPSLSKDLLQGKTTAEDALVEASGFYRDHDIELLTGRRVLRIDTDHLSVGLDDDSQLSFDQLLLTTGSAPRRLDLPGAELGGVHYLRTIDDCLAMRAKLDQGRRVVVVGAGWIGCEVAASARLRGSEVTLVSDTALPLQNFLGEEVARVYSEVHAEHGVRLVAADTVTALEGNETVTRVRTARGQTLECDLVVVGIGAYPRLELARDAGLTVGNGIICDGRLRTSHPRIYAAGDVASHDHPRYGRIRIEHWSNALHQGPAAGRAMLGATEPYTRIPYFYSDQFELGMEFNGQFTGADRLVVRGELASREFVAFWLAGNRVLAGMNVNVWDVSDDIRELIEHRTPVDDDRLRDPTIPVKELLDSGVHAQRQ